MEMLVGINVLIGLRIEAFNKLYYTHYRKEWNKNEYFIISVIIKSIRSDGYYQKL